jgi:hypothetical protein
MWMFLKKSMRFCMKLLPMFECAFCAILVFSNQAFSAVRNQPDISELPCASALIKAERSADSSQGDQGQSTGGSFTDDCSQGEDGLEPAGSYLLWEEREEGCPTESIIRLKSIDGSEFEFSRALASNSTLLTNLLSKLSGDCSEMRRTHYSTPVLKIIHRFLEIQAENGAPGSTLSHEALIKWQESISRIDGQKECADLLVAAREMGIPLIAELLTLRIAGQERSI